MGWRRAAAATASLLALACSPAPQPPAPSPETPSCQETRYMVRYLFSIEDNPYAVIEIRDLPGNGMQGVPCMDGGPAFDVTRVHVYVHEHQDVHSLTVPNWLLLQAAGALDKYLEKNDAIPGTTIRLSVPGKKVPHRS